ncbi:hypothetical protein QC763_0003890 [Podospora pseudopauciseta]|uniref:Uncharacterized protein n=2 Tax=Podospora TaxID=5144 RepID=A0ABR0HWG0_9PEZI|nr:hypothetical protein QC763_0003890 [Podospora pseudopauciseta]KAK4680937.1 hypothetical protein QC764_0003900 [Podospora pseudoanserina]
MGGSNGVPFKVWGCGSVVGRKQEPKLASINVSCCNGWAALLRYRGSITTCLKPFNPTYSHIRQSFFHVKGTKQ